MRSLRTLTPAFLLAFAFVHPAAHASAAVPGIEVVTATGPADSSASKTVQALCPPGKRVVGAGGAAGAFFTGVILTEVTIDPALTSVTVTGHEDSSGTSQQWPVVAYAVCAEPLPGLQLVTVTGLYDSTKRKTVSAFCPPGTQVLGVGGRVDGAAGEVVLASAWVRAAMPGTSAASAHVTGAENGDGTDRAYGVRVHAVCADPLPGYQVLSHTTQPGSPPLQPFQTPACPAGQRVLGVGGRTTATLPYAQVVLNVLVPSARSVSVFAMEDSDGTQESWSTQAQAVCADE
ncbi:hypothetical protein ACIBH1_36715 [Nonomuraea sp. NPDC050663]|uniref:hypothetical protein n=1 Tax=Nonomuraea sp. NPDC050663 TaxID=3364370 RepID=UPI00379EC9AD